MTTYETTSHSVGNWEQAISQARQTMSIPYSTKIGKEDVEEVTEEICENCGKSEDDHTKASKMCFDRFAFFCG